MRVCFEGKFLNHQSHQFTRKGEKRRAVLGQAKLAAFLQTHLQASLPMVFQKLRSIHFANAPAFSLDTGPSIASVTPATLTLWATCGRLPRATPCAGGLDALTAFDCQLP
jgi:hypothetical protein